MPGEIKNITDINDKLNLIKDSHPNLYSIWTTMINKKYVDLLKTIYECETMLEKTKTMDDLPRETIITLILLQNILKN
tara:strand:- start:436 stop:669 length:234 start_codon:yes stop_codon:yes gene_type:complete